MAMRVITGTSRRSRNYVTILNTESRDNSAGCGRKDSEEHKLDAAVKGGPFMSEADFNKWQLEQLNLDTPLLNRYIYASIYKTNYRIVFSHCDFTFHNAIIRDGRIVAIINWEDSG
jgi:hypothetical protein